MCRQTGWPHVGRLLGGAEENIEVECNCKVCQSFEKVTKVMERVKIDFKSSVTENTLTTTVLDIEETGKTKIPTCLHTCCVNFRWRK